MKNKSMGEIVVMGLIVLFLKTLIFSLIWNITIPGLTGFAEITLLQSLGIIILVSLTEFKEDK